MRVHVVDPSAYTPPYDDALCAALARAGPELKLISRYFAYGQAPTPTCYPARWLVCRHAMRHPRWRMRIPSTDDVPLQDLAEVKGPVVLFFGLLRPYKGIEVLLDAWRGLVGAELWIVGRPRMPVEPLRGKAPPGVRFVPRFISDAELPAYFRRADVV